MSPILERLVALAAGVLLGLLLLSEVTLAVSDHTPHVLKIIFIVARRIPTGVVLEDLHDLPSAGMFLSVPILHPISNTRRRRLTFHGQRSRLNPSPQSSLTTGTAPP